MSTVMQQPNGISAINARIDRLPVWGLSRAVFVVVGLSYFFAFYDIIAISFTLPGLETLFHLTGNQLAYPVTFNLVGYLIGSYVLGTVADYLGRRRALMITVIVLALGGILSAFSWNLWSLTVFRFITGLGMGAEIALAATIITELSPAKSRGKYLQINYFWGACGLGFGPMFCLGLLQVPVIGWRLVFLFGAIVAIMLFFMRQRLLPESPRWLVLNQREDQAEDLVAQMENRCRLKTGRELTQIEDVPMELKKEGFPTFALFKKPYLGRILLVFGFWAVFYIADYGYLGYEPTLISKMGISVPTGLLYSMLGDIAFPIGALIGFLLVDRMQRKVFIALVTVVFAIGMILMATGHSSGPIVLGIFLSSMMNSCASVAYVFTAELFPTRARATATSIGDGVGHIGGVVAPFIVVATLAATGARGTFWVLAGIVLVSGLIISLSRVRTNGEALTEIAN